MRISVLSNWLNPAATNVPTHPIHSRASLSNPRSQPVGRRGDRSEAVVQVPTQQPMRSKYTFCGGFPPYPTDWSDLPGALGQPETLNRLLSEVYGVGIVVQYKILMYGTAVLYVVQLLVQTIWFSCRPVPCFFLGPEGMYLCSNPNVVIAWAHATEEF